MMAPNERAGFFIAPPLAPIVWTTVLVFPGLLQGMSGYFGSVLIVGVFGVPIAYAFALVLGLPLYLAARKLGLVNFWSLSLGGAFIAALPTLITLLFLYESWEAGHNWKVHGLFAFTGWFVGTVFWFVLRVWPYNKQFQPTQNPSGFLRG